MSIGNETLNWFKLVVKTFDAAKNATISLQQIYFSYNNMENCGVKSPIVKCIPL